MATCFILPAAALMVALAYGYLHCDASRDRRPRAWRSQAQNEHNTLVCLASPFYDSLPAGGTRPHRRVLSVMQLRTITVLLLTYSSPTSRTRRCQACPSLESEIVLALLRSGAAYEPA